MRHPEAGVQLAETDQEIKIEYDDLEEFSRLELPLDIALDNECVKSEELDVRLNDQFINSHSLQPNFCDNNDSLLDDEQPYSSLESRPSQIFRRRRKPLQPQRAKQTNFPLATFPRNSDNSDDSDVSQDELKDIEQELEEEMVSDDDEDGNALVLNQMSPDTEEHISEFSNTTVEEEYDDGNDEPPDIETDNVFKGLCQEVAGETERLDEKTQKSVEEEWRAHWGVKCNKCNQVFPVKSDFDAHYRDSYQMQPIYTCSYCDKIMNTYSTFRSHCYRHIAEGRFKCPLCTKGFTLKSILEVHMVARHTDIKPYKCEECCKGFVTKTGLNIHLRKHKNNQKEDYHCVICDKVLHTRGGLTAHMNVHRLGRRFMCHMCGKTFTQKVNMRQHVKQHTGERPFKCDECGKSFAEKSHLARHSSFHSDKRPFQCNVCKRMYKTERCLKVHRLVHAVSRPHVCTYCNKGFLSSTKLKQHYNIHTGERPYKCKYCERTFTNYPNWLKHTRRKHNVDHKSGKALVTKLETKEEVVVAPPEPESSDHFEFVQVNNLTDIEEPAAPMQPLTDMIDTVQLDAMTPTFMTLTPEQLVNPAAYPDNAPLFIDYTKLAEHNLLATAVQFTEDTKINMQAQLFSSQFELVTNNGYTNMSFMLPYQQAGACILEPMPAHQNQLIFQSPLDPNAQPFPAHQPQHQTVVPPLPSPLQQAPVSVAVPASTTQQQQIIITDPGHFLHTTHQQM